MVNRRAALGKQPVMRRAFVNMEIIARSRLGKRPPAFRDHRCRPCFRQSRQHYRSGSILSARGHAAGFDLYLRPPPCREVRRIVWRFKRPSFRKEATPRYMIVIPPIPWLRNEMVAVSMQSWHRPVLREVPVDGSEMWTPRDFGIPREPLAQQNTLTDPHQF